MSNDSSLFIKAVIELLSNSKLDTMLPFIPLIRDVAPSDRVLCLTLLSELLTSYEIREKIKACSDTLTVVEHEALSNSYNACAITDIVSCEEIKDMLLARCDADENATVEQLATLGLILRTII